MHISVDDVARAFAAYRRAGEGRDDEVRLAVAVACDAPRDAARAVKEALTPEKANGKVFVAGFAPGRPCAASASASAAVVLAGSDVAGALELAAAWRAAGVACCTVAADAADAREFAASGLARADVLVADPRALPARLGAWLVRALPDGAAALGSCFACCRRARATRAVAEAARGNALLGALPVLDEADLPAMLASELAMLLEAADAFQLEVGPERLKEGAALVAGAFLLRAAARSLGRGRLPKPLVNAVVAGGGTAALGLALINYYERLGTDGAAARAADVVSVEPLEPDHGEAL